MKAALLREYKTPLSIEEAAVPRPGPGQVLLRTEACGVCHSDLHLAEGDWPQLAKIVKLPLILGHEIVGRVVETGPEVAAPLVEDRVGVPWLHWTCGECEFCQEGRENLCLRQAITGATVDGGYAEFVRARASHVLRVPDGLDPEEAAPLFCAGVTVYRALRRAGIRSGERVAIFGIGGLGHLAVQIGAALGARISALDVGATKLELAQALGAERVLDARDPDLRAKFRALGGMHCALVTSAARAAYDAALGSLRRGGTLVVVGVPPEPLAIPPMVLVGGEFRIVASAVGTRADLADVLELAAAGKIRCRTETYPLGDVNDVFAAMGRGSIQGRAVLRP